MCACAVWLFVASASSKRGSAGVSSVLWWTANEAVAAVCTDGKGLSQPSSALCRQIEPRGLEAAQGTLRRGGSWTEPSVWALPQDYPLGPVRTSSELCPPSREVKARLMQGQGLGCGVAVPVRLPQQEHSSGCLCHTGACCRHRGIFQMPQRNTVTTPHGEAGAEGFCSSPRSKALLVCHHSWAKHHCRLSVLQRSLPTLSMSRNIRSSISDYFQNNLQLYWFLYSQKSFFHHKKSKINQSFVSWLKVPRASCVFTSIC